MSNIVNNGYLQQIGNSNLRDESSYQKQWLENLGNYKDLFKSNPSLSFYTSMVCGFAENLPYSMDIEQPEYVPADFFVMMPYDVDENDWFKWDDRRTMYNAMIHWGDTLRSGVLLQVCFIFQKMILGEISPSYELNEAYFEIWGIDKLTGNEKYNRNFFEILKSLPDFYKDLMKAKTIEERRKKLENMYSLIKSQIGQKVGGFRHTDVNGNIIRYDEPSIPWPSEDDVSMLARFAQCDYPSYDKKIVASIRKEQMKRYEERKKGKNRPGNTELEAEIAEDRIADGFLAITEGELVPETKEMAPMEEQ